MKTASRVMQEMAFTDELLEIIEQRDDFTQSDLQGVLGALVSKMLDASECSMCHGDISNADARRCRSCWL